jgi:uncharacterized alpha-E superfamily protein
MLSRVADSFFWFGRNVERAEAVARILDVNYSRAMELSARRPARAERLWRSVMESAGFVVPGSELAPDAATECLRRCAFDPDNASSIASAVRIARGNALGIRSELTTEVWEAINVLYLYVERRNVDQVIREGPSGFLRRIRDWMQGICGIADATMNHGDGWNFMQAGRFLERAYMTARILEAVDVSHEGWREAQRLLEMCCASVPFAQASHRAPEALDAVAFVALSPEFPRSLRFCTRELDGAMHRISGNPEGTFGSPAERRIGRLRAVFDFTPIEEIAASGPSNFASNIRRELELLSYDVEHAYFPRMVAAALGA